MRLARENDADPLIQRGFVVTKRTLLCQAISHRSASLLRASRIVSAGGVPPSGVRAEGVGFAVEALQGLHGGRDQEVIGELR